jgi:hypothetical protein
VNIFSKLGAVSRLDAVNKAAALRGREPLTATASTTGSVNHRD